MNLEPTERATLLARAQAGDAEAFSEICRINATPLLRQAVALSGDVALAEDMAQETLIQAWRCLRRYNGKCQFFTWLCAILLNQYRNAVRKKKPTPLSAFAPSEHEEVQSRIELLRDCDPVPDEAAQISEQSAFVRRCIEALPLKQQEVIYLRFYVDDSMEGIAAALDCSVGTVKSRLFYALENLRSMPGLAAKPEIFTSEAHV